MGSIDNRNRPKIIIIDDDTSFSASLRRVLEREKYDVVCTENSQQARQHLWDGDLFLIDVRLTEGEKDNREGLQLLREFHNERPLSPKIMITAYGDSETIVESIKSGAIDFLEKPLDTLKLKKTIKNSLEHFQLSIGKRNLEQLYKIEPIEFVGISDAIQKIKTLALELAQKNVDVLIAGETGTGKDLLAKYFYQSSWRANGLFVDISLASLPVTIIERELFGHEKGAFTDAKERKIGYIEQANKGMLVLDDIDATPPEVQVKLLTFLQERKLRRLGNTNSISIDTQVIATTNQTLSNLVDQGLFRSDLYFRLNQFEINIPPLRDRPNDVPILANYFLSNFQKQGETHIGNISDDALEMMNKYQWPGNVRELKSSIQKATIYAKMNKHDRIELDDLPYEISHTQQDHSAVNVCQSTKINRGEIDLERETASFVLSCIEKALQESNGIIHEANRLLKLNDRFAIRRKIKSIRNKFPDLIETFPMILRTYSKYDS